MRDCREAGWSVATPVLPVSGPDLRRRSQSEPRAHLATCTVTSQPMWEARASSRHRCKAGSLIDVSYQPRAERLLDANPQRYAATEHISAAIARNVRE